MMWKVGQMVQCDRPDRSLRGSVIQIEAEGVIISCPASNTVVCGSQQQLERLGWKIVSPVLR
jgi:hypothetical protein